MRVTNGISKQPEVLEDRHIPDRLIARERQIEELRRCLAPALRGRKPLHAWLHGEPGTGKTAVAKFVLQQLTDQTPVRGIYINCWEHRTLYSIADKLITDLRIMFADRPDVSLKLDRFAKAIGKKPFVLVLDEIDKPETKERNAILYRLSNIGNIGLVCICNSRSFLLGLDKRIQSRLSARQIGFCPYALGDVVSILKHRTEVAYENDFWNTHTLEKIAELSEGDARMAIQTLRKAAEIAESSDAPQISEEHLNNAWNSTNELKKKYMLEGLTEHHRILHDIIKEQPGISSGKLWESFLKACNQEGKKPIATRTFSAYLARLIKLALIAAERAEKRDRVFRVL